MRPWAAAMLALVGSEAYEAKNYYSIKGTAPKWHDFKPCSANYFKIEQYCLACPVGKFSAGGSVAKCKYKVRCSHLRCTYEGSDAETGRNGHTSCAVHGADGSRYTQGALGFGADADVMPHNTKSCKLSHLGHIQVFHTGAEAKGERHTCHHSRHTNKCTCWCFE